MGIKAKIDWFDRVCQIEKFNQLPYLIVKPNYLIFERSGGNARVLIESNASWFQDSDISDFSWIKLNPPLVGLVSGDLIQHYSIDPYPSDSLGRYREGVFFYSTEDNSIQKQVKVKQVGNPVFLEVNSFFPISLNEGLTDLASWKYNIENGTANIEVVDEQIKYTYSNINGYNRLINFYSFAFEKGDEYTLILRAKSNRKSTHRLSISLLNDRNNVFQEEFEIDSFVTDCKIKMPVSANMDGIYIQIEPSDESGELLIESIHLFKDDIDFTTQVIVGRSNASFLLYRLGAGDLNLSLLNTYTVNDMTVENGTFIPNDPGVNEAYNFYINFDVSPTGVNVGQFRDIEIVADNTVIKTVRAIIV